MTTVVRGYPAASDRCRGWLRYLFRKATTPDDWDKTGKPHDHWDNITRNPWVPGIGWTLGHPVMPWA